MARLVHFTQKRVNKVGLGRGDNDREGPNGTVVDVSSRYIWMKKIRAAFGGKVEASLVEEPKKKCLPKIGTFPGKASRAVRLSIAI